jgi:hypothetical protein
MDFSNLTNITAAELLEMPFSIWVFWMFMLVPVIIGIYAEANLHGEKNRIDSPDWYYTTVMAGSGYLASAVCYILGDNWLWAAAGFIAGMFVAGVVLSAVDRLRRSASVTPAPRAVHTMEANVRTVPMHAVRDCEADCVCGSGCSCENCA